VQRRFKIVKLASNSNPEYSTAFEKYQDALVDKYCLKKIVLQNDFSCRDEELVSRTNTRIGNFGSQNRPFGLYYCRPDGAPSRGLLQHDQEQN
jgi:hypothetical protein